MDPSTPTAGNGDLMQDLDRRQDEVLRELDRLACRIESAIQDYVDLVTSSRREAA